MGIVSINVVVSPILLTPNQKKKTKKTKKRTCIAATLPAHDLKYIVFAIQHVAAC